MKLVTALSTYATATPTRIRRSGLTRPSFCDNTYTTAKLASPNTERGARQGGLTPEREPAEQDHQHRADAGAARDAKQIRFGDRVAHHSLHRDTNDR